MAYHGLSRPAGVTPRCSPPPTHARWLPGHLTGSLQLLFTTSPGRFVSPGTGRLKLGRRGNEEIVALEAARSAGRPVLPGSGIKGAVRTVYELLSWSCDPFAKGGPCSRRQCCEACSLFGALGGQGRVSFGDAAAPRDDAVSEWIELVPVPWEPDGRKTEGDFRFYDRAPAAGVDRETRRPRELPRELAREVYSGEFRGKMTFVNLRPEELGRLLLCMGVQPADEDLPSLHLRLGGVKYDGQGGVAVTPLRLRLAAPEREELEPEEAGRRCREWMGEALASSWAATFRPTIARLSETLNAGGAHATSR